MLTNEFLSLCKEFAKTHEDVLSEEIEDSKKLCRYRIEFYRYILEFRYVKKEFNFFKSSTLYCVIALKKNSIVHYHLTDIIPFLEQKSFKACYFWNIESPRRFKCCFESLISTIEFVTSQIEPFLLDDTPLLNSLFLSYKTIYSLKDNDIDFNKIDDEKDFAHAYFTSLQNVRDGYIFSRFSKFVPYELLLKNKTAKALSKYEKLNQKGKLLEYEKQLLNYINDSENGVFSPFDSYCDTYDLYNKFLINTSYIKAFLVVFVITSLVLCGFCAIYNLIASIDTVVMLSAPWYIGFLPAALCSVFGSIVFFPHMPNKHFTKEERKNLYNIFITKADKYFSITAFVASIVVALLIGVIIIASNVRFYKDEIKFDSKAYTYSQIDSVYYISARYNVYDDRIERSSYVILFEDKTSLDLDGYTSVSYTQKNVLPLLKEKGFEIKKADSERQLP